MKNKVTINPSQNQLSFHHVNQPVEVIIYDVLGRKALTRSLDQDTTFSHDLRSGMYLVHLTQGNRTVVEKLIVE